jgi:polyisoprenoid-binding protein YceI
MKTIHIALGLLLLAGAASAQTLKVDTAASKLEWVGKKVTGQHNGTVNIKSGTVNVEKGKLSGGEFLIDMASIKVLDLEGESNGKLTGHLKSDDFFSTDKFPEASFEITNVKDGIVTGDLTIKGFTNSLTFPADVKIIKGVLTATAKGIKVDRTLYEIRYGSGRFFDNLGDKVINDEFIMDLTLTAKK